MISLLITAVLFALICYLLMWALSYLGAPEPIRKVCVVLIVIVAVLWILGNFPFHLPNGIR